MHARGAGHRRSIPTCVGTTIFASSSLSHGAVHPHVRGDYSGSPWRRSAFSGPSPRAWGLRAAAVLLRLGLRSNPTCVGTTERPESLQAHTAVHPHVRGDYPWPWPKGLRRLGPSPRAWGLRALSPFPFTPPRVHPHVRGDYSLRAWWRRATTGPSPRAWGLRPASSRCARPARSIPTCVGTTPWEQRLWEPPRSIPTCVGTTLGMRKWEAGTSVHPHVRGDYARGPPG